MGTSRKKSWKNGESVWKVWTVNAAIYFCAVINFFLMDSFWNEIRDFDFDLKSLLKVRNYLEKLEKRLQETKHKKLKNLSKHAEIKS